MTLVIEVASNAAASSWTDRTAIVPWRDGVFGGKFGGVAHQCEIGTGAGFNLDDDAGTVVLPAKRAFRVTETATTPDTILMRGRISDKSLARAQMLVGDSKGYDTTVDDTNAELRGIVVDAWNRPAETGYARMQALGAAFLNGSPRASTVIDYTTYVPNTNTVTMPAKRYDLTDPAGVIVDIATVEGKQAFITEDRELFLDLDTSTAYAATLSITDVGANGTTSFYPETPGGTQSGNEFFSGAKLRYGSSGSVSDVRSSAETAHDYWRTVISDPDATASTASQRLATLLDNQSVEELRYTCDLTLLASQVDKIKRGHTVSFRSASAGVLTPVTLRVASLYWEPVAVDRYKAHLELGVPQKLARRVHRGTLPPPAPWVCVPTDFTVYTDIPSPGLSCVAPAHGVTPQECISSNVTGEKIKLYAGATYRVDFEVYHSPDSFNLYAQIGSPSDVLPINIEMGANRAAGLTFTPGSPPPETFATATYTPSVTDDFRTSLGGAIAATGCDDFASSISTRFTYISGPDPRFAGLPPCSNGAPGPGEEAADPTFIGDGTTTTFTVGYPGAYQAGSLRIKVNGLDWTPWVHETDPTTGAYDVDYPFPLGSDVIVTWKGA